MKTNKYNNRKTKNSLRSKIPKIIDRLKKMENYKIHLTTPTSQIATTEFVNLN